MVAGSLCTYQTTINQLIDQIMKLGEQTTLSYITSHQLPVAINMPASL